MMPGHGYTSYYTTRARFTNNEQPYGIELLTQFSAARDVLQGITDD